MFDEYTSIEYKGYLMDYNYLNRHEWSVVFCGDIVVFATESEAEEFIDSLVEGGDQ